jgi:type VI secretion system ImpC/EvpB family protein
MAVFTDALAAEGLDRFLAERATGAALRRWLGPVRLRPGEPLRRYVVGRLSRDVAEIDRLINGLVNAILHHPNFQRLEASWRGLHYLVHQVPEAENIKVRVLNLSWRELTRDLDRALEFDQSQLFRKVYSDEFGTPGGEPISVLLADYEVHPRPGPDHAYDDMGTLGKVAEVAAAAFSPFIIGAHPAMLDVEKFADLERPRDLARVFEQPEFVKWRALRETEDVRFVGLTLPRVLMRLPYTDDSGRADDFCFREEVGDPSRANYLWGSAVFAFGAVLIREFASSGWLAAIRGYQRGTVQAGLVSGLPVPWCRTDRRGVAPLGATDARLTEAQEKQLGESGFMPLSPCPGTEVQAFFTNPSIQRPKQYDEAVATSNARLSAMLQYMLCVARFAHYVKVLGRDKVGTFAGPEEVENFLMRWLQQYTAGNETMGLELKAKYPLREAKVEVRRRPDSPGVYTCVIHLRPHFQLDQIVTAVRLVTELAAPA